MDIPTNDDIHALLDQLDTRIADDLESAYLDFKPWRDPKKDMAVAVEYAVCFANADGGVVVFGVADKTRGRAAAIHGAKSYDIDVWKRGIYAATRPHLDVEIDELTVQEGTGKLLIVRVGKGSDAPYGTSQGLYKVRVGKNCMPLDPPSFARTRIAAGNVDWSGMEAEGVTRADLDAIEVARARNVLSGRDPDSDLLALEDAAFLTALGALRNGRVTHTGLLLFGREQVLRERCPQHLVHYAHQISETELARNDFFRCGLLQILERITIFFSGPSNPETEVRTGFFKMRIPAYPVTVVQEALLNAVTHRSYADPQEVFLRHTPHQLTILSPGGFVGDITPGNILRHDPMSRNPTLAEAFQKLRLVEKSGVGRRRIFLPMLEYGKRIPVYETDSGGGRVILHLWNGRGDQRMAAWVGRRKELGHKFGLDALMILSKVRTDDSIDVAAAEALLQLPRREVERVLGELENADSGLLERRSSDGAVVFVLKEQVLRELDAMLDVPEREEKHAEQLFETLAQEPTSGNARRVREHLEQKGSVSVEEHRRLTAILDSEAGRELERTAPLVFAGLRGILQASGADTT